MKIKKENGITIMTLIITIIVLLILAGVGITAGTNIMKDMELKNVKTNLLLIQAKVKTIYEKHNFDDINNPLVGTKILEIDSKYEAQTTKENGEQYEFYELSEDDIKNTMQLDDIEYDEGYIVNYENGDVIYKKGVEDKEGNIYYALSQMKPEQEQ